MVQTVKHNCFAKSYATDSYVATFTKGMKVRKTNQGPTIVGCVMVTIVTDPDRSVRNKVDKEQLYYMPSDQFDVCIGNGEENGKK